MWRAVFFLVAALTVAVPRPIHAQESDSQNPREYTDEDSHPLRILAYVLSPIGFALEWGIARPLHYVATQSDFAPVFNNDTRTPTYVAPPPIPLDDVGDEPPRPEPGTNQELSSPQRSAPLDTGRQPQLH